MNHLLQIKTGLGILLLSLALAGCGSSGDGDDDDDVGNEDLEPLVYEGKTTEAAIGGGNARDLTRSVAGIYKIVGNVNVEFGGLRPAAAPPPNFVRFAFERIAAIRQNQVAAAIRDATGRRSAQRTAVDQTRRCDRGRLRIFGFLEESDSTGELSFDFINCRADGVTLNGIVVARISKFDRANDIEADIKLVFRNLSIRAGNGNIAIGGSIRYVIDAAAHSQRETIGKLVILDRASGRMLNIVGLVSVHSFDDIFKPRRVTIDIRRGRIFDSKYGYVDIVATSLVGYSKMTLDFPDSGVYDLIGKGSSIRASAIDRFQLHLQVDTDNDPGNGYEVDRTLLWVDL